MKTQNLMWLAAAGLVMTACSADEPSIKPDQTPASDGNLYMSVNIMDAGQMHFGAPSRATRADYEDGSEFEHTITSARFFFFDAQGRYLTEANIWRDGTEVTDDDNIEYKGKNMLVLKNVTDRSSIKYMLTVLNAPEDLKPVENLTTLDELAKTTFESVWRDANINGKDQKVFYMSTSSFNPEGKAGYDSNYYYANALQESDFITVDDDASKINPDDVTPVNVYVERLAAKVTLSGLQDYMPITLTVAGLPGNPELDPDQIVAGQKLYIHFLDWDVSGVDPKTYLSKQLDLTQNYFTNWNSADRFRSFWAQSVQYGAEPSNSVHKTFNQLQYAINQAAYERETTNQVGFISNSGKLIPNNVATALLSAEICAEVNGVKTPVDMVMFQGVLYSKEHYINYELKALNSNQKLNFYKRVGDKFFQIGANDVKLATADNYSDGTIVLAYAGNAADQLYSLTPGADPELEASYQLTGIEQLNQNLADFNKTAPAEAYVGGLMFYSIPIEHLVGPADKNNVALGNYGLVRNHWYQITVNKVLNLGHGIFDPDQQQLRPGDNENPEKYGLGAVINVLSWRIVNQNVDL